MTPFNCMNMRQGNVMLKRMQIAAIKGFYHICGLWSLTSSHSAAVCGPQSDGHLGDSLCFFSEGCLFLGLGCVCSDCI